MLTLTDWIKPFLRDAKPSEGEELAWRTREAERRAAELLYGCPIDRYEPSWEELVAQEPRLGDLLAEALAVDPGTDAFCADTAFSFSTPDEPSFRHRLEQLVGWHSKHRNPLLGTEQSWGVVMQKIQQALPPCTNHCGCYD